MEHTIDNAYYSIYSGTASIFAFFFAIFLFACMWILFKKAGHAGIKSIIPIYNIYTIYKIAWGNGWIFLLLLVPIVNIVVSIIHNFKLAKAFGHGFLFSLGLLFLPLIFIPILALGSSQYQGPAY